MNNEWRTDEPPNEVMVRIKASDFRGEYTALAMRKDFKKPNPGQSTKGFRKGWRWIGANGITLGRKETPEAWQFYEGP